MTNTRIAVAFGAAALALALAAPAQAGQGQAAPGSGHGHGQGDKHGQAGKKPDAAKHEQMMMDGMTDAEFVPMMIEHHQHGIEMARREEEEGASDEVKALAAQIRQGQERELAELKAHAKEGHGAATTGTSGRAGHEKMDTMMKQQSQATMQRLKAAEGEALDAAFLEEMAKHHQQAIMMTEHTKFKSAELRTLAEKMAADQKKELAELKRLRAKHEKSE